MPPTGSTPTCARCGAPLPPDAAECPRCLLRLGMPAGAQPQDAPASGRGSGPRLGPPPTLEEVRAAFPGLEIEALLGQGGMGAVFRARQPRLERPVALKVLPRALAEDPSFTERFAREARALARLSHPGIVAVHDFGCADGWHYLVMELVEGENLRAVLRRGPLEPRQALTIARELCDALQYAHDEGVVHRDIKPENVLLDARGRVKVADFGLAKLVGAEAEALLTRADQVMGTPHYMAPEQLERPLDVDHRADLFALGVVLYEMLTGSLPRGKFEPPSQRVHVDVGLDEIVLKALEREPTRRYQHALEIKSDVEHLPAEGGAAVAPGRESPGAPASAGALPARRERGLFRAAPAPAPEHGWRGAALLALAWVLLGASWNLGAFAFGLATVGVSALFGWLLRRRVQAVPEWNAALGRLPARERAARRVVLPLGTLLCVALVALGHVAHWERGTHAWHPSVSGASGLFEAWSRDPWSLLRMTTAPDRLSFFFPAETEPRVVLARGHTSAALDLPAAVVWTFLLGGFVLLAGILAASVHVRGEPALARRAWRLGGELASYGLLALVVLWIGAPIAALRRPRVLQAVAGECTSALEVEEAAARLRAALAEHGLEVDVAQEAAVIERRSARELARATFVRAAASSPFERWETSLSGAIRATPQVWATLVQRVDGTGSRVVLRAGLLDPRRPEHEETHALLRALEAALAP